ncbi:MAG: histidine phosphatase family protein [Firmicutes bacterium]|nr:histidine phosphatase family protein [Bacillota bacterium]
MRLIFVRHGETIWNRQLKMQGRSDVPLSEKGKRQAHMLAASFTARPHYLFVSPLKRAQDFALPLQRRFHLQPIVEEKLREIDFGAWEGLTYAEMTPAVQEQYAAWCEDPCCITPPGGEAFAQVAARVQAFLTETQKQLEEQESAVVITHGGVIRTAVTLAMEMPLKFAARVRIDAASKTILECFDGNWYLVKLNCTEHLQQCDGKGV